MGGIGYIPDARSNYRYAFLKNKSNDLCSNLCWYFVFVYYFTPLLAVGYILKP